MIYPVEPREGPDSVFLAFEEHEKFTGSRGDGDGFEFVFASEFRDAISAFLVKTVRCFFFPAQHSPGLFSLVGRAPA